MRVRFVLRKSRLNSLGQCPLDCRVRVNGVQAIPFSTHIMVVPVKWDSKAQRIKGSSESVLQINRRLEEIRYDIEQLFISHRAKGVILRSQELVNIYNGKKELGCKYLSLCEKKIAELRSLGRSRATIQIHKKCHRYLFEYLGENLEVNDIKKKDVQNFWQFLKDKGYDHDYVNKTVSNCKSLFNYGEKNGFLDENPLGYISFQWQNKEDYTYPNDLEMKALHSIEWSPVLQRVVDSYLFMCYQGLHISDYRKLAESDIQQYKNSDWIKSPRTKNGSRFTVPVHPIAKKIILKYDGIKGLPKLSGQKNNDHLKIIAERINTNKHLTNKTARKKFTDTCLNEYLMSEESVAAMLGHKSTRWVRKYGSVRQERIHAEYSKHVEI